ncbi:zinc-dependent alcohol dehydrogenase [Microbacterium marinilacus]|uniref:Zinc-binding dehydrogenase n=1 Tax=Microbacterium marinilacus TaxID=415209 RepID=A0ABP7BGX3_9MICO|nr:alcohol dehydrogenase catalytic domain-containing protein [Microbacterium marinilacus]MBY0690348.1 alcohol dehydrogenase catalytic domain-containing protein [Microbacterium marinilacus]
MTTSRAALLTGPDTVELVEYPVPDVGEDDAVLRIEAAALCGSDIAQVRSGLSAGRPTHLVPGHEPMGVVHAIGRSAARRWGVGVGDRVAVEVVVPCHECPSCAVRNHVACERSLGAYGYRPFESPTPLIGGFADYMYLHPQSVVHRIDAEVPVAEAAMFNSIAAGVRWAGHLGDVRPGATVVILGAGQRGIAAAIAARQAGAEQIIVTGLAQDAHKLDAALAIAADSAVMADSEDVPERVRELTGGRLADVVLDLTPDAAQPVQDALEAVRPGGRVVLAGLKHGRGIELVTDRIVQKGITVVGARGVESTSIDEAIALIESRRFPLDLLHTHSFGLDEVVHAIDVLAGVPDDPAIHVSLVP